MFQYRLKHLIGAGTFGEVWHAQRVDAEGRVGASDVALKIALYDDSHPQTQREHRVLLRTAALQYKGIKGTIQLLDITMRDNRLVVAMELAEGSLLAKGAARPSAIEALRGFREVAETLDALHAMRIVHGGINPTDILLHDGQAKIADFCAVPHEGDVCRIPLYKSVCMAPELINGVPHAESDQYALAATYAWLRLKEGPFPIPFRGDLPGAINVQAIPEPELGVLTTALDRDPKRRFTSCSAFVKALERAVSGSGKGTATDMGQLNGGAALT